MNALQIADALKNLSDQQLAGMRGRVPEYLLTADLSRRAEMRRSGQASQALAQKSGGRTVSDDLWNSVMAPPQPPMMGPPRPYPSGPAPQQMMGPPQPQQPMSIGGLVNRMSGGGIARYADGGLMKYLNDIVAAVGERPNAAVYQQQAQQMAGPDNLAAIAAEMQNLRAQPVVRRASPWEALMQGGAAAMASRNPTPLGGIGEGISAGMARFSQDRDAHRADQIRQQQAAQKMLDLRGQVAQQQNQRGMGIAELGGRMASDASHMRNTDLATIANARLAEAAHTSQRQISDADNASRLGIAQMQIDANAPFKQSQINENNAQAEARAIQAQVFQSYLKKADGDPAKAQIMMARDQAAAQYIERPQRLSPLESLQMQVIAEGKAAGESADDILGRLARLKSRNDLTEEKMNERATRLYRTLLDNNPMAKMDPKVQEALWNQAVQMAAVGDFKQGKPEPVKPARLGIKLGSDGSIVMPNAKQQQQPVTGPFRVNLDQVMNPR